MQWITATVVVLLQLPLGWYVYNQTETIPPSLTTTTKPSPIVPAADQFFKYYDYIKGKRLALVVNHTSMVGSTHLVDTLLSLDCKVQKVFAPEHGFRGRADAGERLADKIDPHTGLPLISLYGKNKRPSSRQMENIDLVIFDVQDVGTRFYTYTSTMTYVMEACAEAGVPLLILDRPNPNGHYVDGPVLEAEKKSFVGLHPVPIVHGLTVAEYARMINEEGWLRDGGHCELYHVECANYSHKSFYQLPIAPSPNLPNMRSIYLYPSLCWFEGTTVSVGRGTNKQFQIYGQPKAGQGGFEFVPEPKAGAKYPKHEDKRCEGYDLSELSLVTLQKGSQLELDYLLDFYKTLSPTAQKDFFKSNNFFDLLAGTTSLQAQMKSGADAASIRASWQVALQNYKQLRKKYLLYPDFE
ncbi:MAG: exo-beta-N-acetylmuramidase NamZ family protein [Aureispira sp.]